MERFNPQGPPAPPPKPPASHDASRIASPAPIAGGAAQGLPREPPSSVAPPQPISDPGDQWLPKFLQDKSKHDLADVLSNPALLSALTHSPRTIHPSLRASHDALQPALAENLELANLLLDLEARLAAGRASAQAQLLATHALERQWRTKQGGMDSALGPFAPASLYQRLVQGVQEQEGVCVALEDSFLEHAAESGDAHVGEGGFATEREAGEWVRRYREAKKLYYLRQERKERWDEGRVGGWR